MPHKDLHEKPFDEATLAKLDIFESYSQAWIPTFVMSKTSSTICIFDFFAGTGFDKKGIPGSPIRILRKIKEQVNVIFQKSVTVKVVFNELNHDKFTELSEACLGFLKDHPEMERAIDLILLNERFEECFPTQLHDIRRFPSLVYLDQNGIQFLSDKYFLELESTSRTDFLYFVSASYFWRFGNTAEFQNHLPLDLGEAKRQPYKFIHRSLLGQLRSSLPPRSEYKLYPYTLKKGSNIYGIIFGASHPRAVDKFLSIAWKKNPVNGEANFDIDNDEAKGQMDLFEGRRLSKIEGFQQRLREKVLRGDVKTNEDAYNFVLEEGHAPRHAKEELQKMKREGLINFASNSPLVTYEKVHKSPQLINYKVERA